MPRMDFAHREMIVHLRHTRNWTIKDIAQEMECSEQQVSRVLLKWRAHGTVADLHRQPRHRCTTRTQDVAICCMGQRQPHRRPREDKLHLRCHTHTIKCRWNEERHVARKKWFMTARHAYYRLAWTHEMIQTHTSAWDRIIGVMKRLFAFAFMGGSG